MLSLVIPDLGHLRMRPRLEHRPSCDGALPAGLAGRRGWEECFLLWTLRAASLFRSVWVTGCPANPAALSVPCGVGAGLALLLREGPRDPAPKPILPARLQVSTAWLRLELGAVDFLGDSWVVVQRAEMLACLLRAAAAACLPAPRAVLYRAQRSGPCLGPWEPACSLRVCGVRGLWLPPGS